MYKTFSKIPKLFGSFLLIALLPFSFGCSSIAEDAEVIIENENFYSDLITSLENMQWESNTPNARRGKAVPTFRVTITTLQKLNVVQPAVQDRATVLIATDEAFLKMGITPENVEDNLPLLGAIVFYQTISGQTIKGSNLAGNTFTNMAGASLSFSAENGVLSVSDEFDNHANIIRTDWGALNSTSHFIDTVLVPSSPQ